MTERTGTCPRCSRPRLGFLRYCLDCGFDYELPEAATQPPADARPSTPDDGTWPALPASAALLGAPLPPAPPRAVLPLPPPVDQATPPSIAPTRATPAESGPAGFRLPAVGPATPRVAAPTPARPAVSPPAPVPARPAASAAAPDVAAIAPRQVATAVPVRTVARRRGPGRQRLIGQLGLVAIAIVLGAGALSTALSATDTGPSAPLPSIGPGTTLPVSGGSGNLALGPTGTSEAAIVTSVIDGDTIRVQVGTQEHTVRYLGIDAPAMDDADPTTRALAAAARDRNAALVADRTVILERDTSDTDEEGRLLRYVWFETDGGPELVNLRLVRLGLARVATQGPSGRYANEFRAAEVIARRAEAGMWIPSAAPTTTLIIDDRLYFIEAGTRERFTGGAGAYRWTALAIDPGQATASWTATAPANDACAVTWTLEPAQGVEISGSIDVPHGGKETGNRVVDLTATDAALAVSSTCERWAVAFER